MHYVFVLVFSEKKNRLLFFYLSFCAENVGPGHDGQHRAIPHWFYWCWNANSGDTGELFVYLISYYFVYRVTAPCDGSSAMALSHVPCDDKLMLVVQDRLLVLWHLLIWVHAICCALHLQHSKQTPWM